ncbi:MAG: hypothetical protein Q9205_007013, partial [Flavoplaca limonia]
MSLDTPPLDDPNFDLYADQRGRIIGSCTAFIVLTTIVVVLRLLSRKLAHAGFWWDDHFSVIAWAFSTLGCVMLLIRKHLFLWLKEQYSETIGPDPILELKNGYGRHIYIWGEVEGPLKMRQWRKILYVFELFFHTSTTLAKYSILAFYWRIFPVASFRRIIVWTTILCTVYMIAIDLTVIFQCQPIRHAWDQVVGASEGHCINEYRFFVGSGSANAVLNVLVFILPMPLLWRLRTTARQQIILTAIFTLAGFVVLVSIIWVVVLAELKASDVTWNFINAGIWSALEPSMAVICACIPSLRPLFSLASRSLRNSNVPSFSTPRIVGGKFTGPSSSKQRTWPGSGRGKISDGMFSQLDEGGADDTKPLGHDVSVHGGGEADEGVELPERGIQVKTEVR